MDRIKRYYISWGSHLFLSVLIIALLAQCAYFPFLRTYLLPFIAFVCVYLIIPSVALSGYIFREAGWAGHIRLLLAYPIVLCAYFVIAWVLTIVRMPLLVHALPVIAIAVLMLRPHHINFPKNTFNKPDTWLAVTVFTLLIAFWWLGLWVPGVPPTAERVGILYQDQLWAVGNIWATIRGGWPLMDARALGEPLSYHLAQTFIHSVAYRVTEIPPYFLQNYFFPVIDLFFLVAVLVSGARVVGGLSFQAVLWMCVALLFTTGYGEYFHDWNPLTFFYSLAPFTLFVFVLKAYFEGRIKLPIYYLAGLYFLLIATKVVLVIIILPALAATYIWRVIKGGTFVYKPELWLGALCAVMTFADKYMLFSTNSRGMHFATVIAGSRVWQWLSVHLSELPHSVIELIFGLYLFVTRTPVFLIAPAGGVLIVLAIIRYKNIQRGQIQPGIAAWSFFIVAMFLVSVIDRYFTQYDPSEAPYLYFEWYPEWLLPLLAAGWLSITQVSRRAWGIILGITSIGIVAFWVFEAPPVLASGKINAQQDMRETIDIGEWEALTWVNRNLPERAIIASDRRVFRAIGKKRDQPRFFHYSGLSGRQFLMEGEAFIGGETRVRLERQWTQFETILASNDAQALSDFLRPTPAQYFFQSLRFDKLDLSRLPDYKLIHENPSVRIYSIAHAQ